MPTLSIEEQVSQTYLENITYLQEHQPLLFQKILEFESALDNDHYQSKYELEYKEEGYFDVKEFSSEKYFYNLDSKQYGKKAKKLVNFKKSESVFKTYYDFNFSQDELSYYDNLDISSSSYYAYAEIMNYTKAIAPESTEMKEIKKFIFFGVGLGTHLEEIDQKIGAENYLIIEDDLELFRLSLFVTNYKKLASNAKLFFSVFEEDDRAKIIFDVFLQKSFYYNHYIKYFQMHSSNDTKMKIMHTTVTGQSHLIFLFSSYFKVYLRALTYLKKGYNFLDMSGKDVEKNSFLGKPVMIVAAGPSLSKNLDWLEQHRDKFVIVALSATLRILEKRGIKPDIVTHLDPFEETCMLHVDRVEKQEFYDDCILFCGSQTPEILINKFQKDKVFIAQVNISYKKSFDYVEPICVGSFTYMVLAHLGARDIYTLGLDQALDGDTGLSHSKEHSYARMLDTKSVDKVEDTMAYLKAVVKVKGNFKDEVLATLTFNKSIVAINNFTKMYKKDFQNVYNLNDGAYMDEFIPTKIKDVDIDSFEMIDKEVYISLLIDKLKNKSENALTDKELASMQKRHVYAKKLIRTIETSKYPQTFNTTLYRSQLLGLTLDILDEHDSEAWDLHNTYLSYLNFILPFVFDMLNTKGIKNEKRHIKKIHKLLTRYCLEIATYYEQHVEEFFEEEVAN